MNCIAFCCSSQAGTGKQYCAKHDGWIKWSELPVGSLFEFQSEENQIHRKNGDKSYFDRLAQTHVPITGFWRGVEVKVRKCES